MSKLLVMMLLATSAPTPEATPMPPGWYPVPPGLETLPVIEPHRPPQATSGPAMSLSDARAINTLPLPTEGDIEALREASIQRPVVTEQAVEYSEPVRYQSGRRGLRLFRGGGGGGCANGSCGG